MNARVKVSKNEGKATHIVNSSPCISYRRNISHGLGHARKLRNNQYKRLSHQKRLARAFRDPTAFHFLGCNLRTVLSKVLHQMGCILRALPLDPKSMGRRKHVEPLCRAVTQTVRKDDHKCRSLYVFPLRYTTIPSEANSTSTALPKYGKQRVLLGYVFSTDQEKIKKRGHSFSGQLHGLRTISPGGVALPQDLHNRAKTPCVLYVIPENSS